MPANTTPIYPLTPNVTVGQVIITANTAKDGTGTVVTAYTAGANGGKPEAITFRATGTNVATVCRIFINNGSTNATIGNNALFSEITLPATTLSEVAALADMRYQFPDNFRMPAGYKVLLTIGTTTATNIACTCYAADY